MIGELRLVRLEEAYVAFFLAQYRGSTRSAEQLAAKVLDLLHRATFRILCNAICQGAGKTQRDDLEEQPTWNVYGWLAYVADIDRARVEMSIGSANGGCEPFTKTWKNWSRLQRTKTGEPME